MFYYFTSQDLLTSSLLNDEGHKTYHVPHRGMHSPLQVGMMMFVFIQVPNTVSCWPLKKLTRFHVLSAAATAQFLGAGDLWENRGARLRAEQQVYQHLPYEDIGDVDRDRSGNINARCAGHGVAGFIFVVVQQLGEASRHQCFYT